MKYTGLAIDTSRRTGSISVIKNGYIAADELLPESITHSSTLLSEIEKLLKKSDLRPNDLDFTAYSSGPGSFTGIRIAAATAQGLSRSIGCKVFGVSKFEVYRYFFCGENSNSAILLEAGGEEFFLFMNKKPEKSCPRSPEFAEITETSDHYLFSREKISDIKFSVLENFQNLVVPEEDLRKKIQAEFSIADKSLLILQNASDNVSKLLSLYVNEFLTEGKSIPVSESPFYL